MTQHNPAVNTPGDRDEQLEHWLRDGWAPEGEQTALCLDAETAAAWADGLLVGAPLEQAQGHAATCARCQALLATLVRTADDAARSTPASEAEQGWRRWFTWVVPLTAAATAVVALAVWVRTPQPAEPSSARGASAPVVRASESPAPQVDGRGLPVVPSPSAAIDATGQTSSSPLRSRGDALNRPQTAQARQNSDAPRVDTSTDAREARPQRLEEAQGQSALGKTTGALADAAEARKAEPAAAAVAAPAPPPPPPAPSPAPPSPAAAARATGGASTPAEPAAASGPTLFRSVAPLQERVGWTIVIAPDRVAQWRFDGSQVQHSIDRGVTWTTVDQIQASQIRAGSAPTSSVCWLAGQGGLVLLTTNGTSWNRTSLPAAVDLVAVVATDARTASVTAIDGRQFQTTDGGRTWTAR